MNRKVISIILTFVMIITLLNGCSNQIVESTADPTPAEHIKEKPVSYAETIVWDAGYDVVVIGYGGAGATASISASEQGAKVLLLEKAPKGEEGGNSKYSGQIVLNPTDREKAIEYYEALRGGFDTQSDEIIEAMVDGTMSTKDWLAEHGAKEFFDFNCTEYPSFPGADGINAFVIDKQEIQTGRVYHLLQDNVVMNKDKIDVWFESPGVELIQDPEFKAIIGVKVNRKGELINVYAKNGVVLATGGFENNEEMIENYLQLPYGYSKAARYNTGDGITMALNVGAKLWHMGNLAGPDVNFVIPETNISAGYSIQGPGKFGQGALGSKGTIFVGSDGTRFTNESFMTNHGHVNVSGTWKMLQPPIPAYAIFDDSAMKSGPIYSNWSNENSEELEKGWIVKADTIEELAEKININKEGLKKQVDLYNKSVKEQFDPQFYRDCEYLVPISETGPYYSMELKPTFTNTQGGPERDKHAQVIGMDNKPIPHLYSAGELGSYHVDLYQGAGNIAECIYSGNIAGKNAAKPKDDTPILEIENKISSDLDESVKEIVLNENEFLGEGRGIGGAVKVKVTLDRDKILSIEIVSHNESDGISDKAISDLPTSIVERQSTEVDTISGATVTSKAIIEAVNNALEQAKQ